MSGSRCLGIDKKLGGLPRRPGVYLMKDERDKIIYVGKAADLRQRVRSYFQSSQNLSPKMSALVNSIRDLDYTVTDTEVEALILESNLIKEYRPRYNIDLKDDKQYPYLRIDVQEAYPGIQVVRRVEKDGARYFGPYTHAGAVRETVRLIRRLFPLRHCRRELLPKNGRRPCLNRHINSCSAPCAAEISQEDYKKLVAGVLLFLEGKQDLLLGELYGRMTAAADNLEFEKAARLRDQYRAVEGIMEKQKIIAAEGGDRDIIALAGDENLGCAQLFAVRRGKLTGREHYILTNPAGEETKEMLAAFLRCYYTLAPDVPPEILLCGEIDEREILAQWLSNLRGRRVRLSVPQRGQKKDLMRLAMDNAAMFLREEQLRQKVQSPREALAGLAEILSLDCPPLRIEGYDISHLHGEGTVASMVVFEAGLPVPGDYRRFKIRSVDKPDDYASLREALSRRFTRLAAARQEEAGPDVLKNPFLLVPDLILIDGGPGQLSSALQSLSELRLTDIAVISLAKENETIYQANNKKPVQPAKHSAALQLLRRIRDEAHRYAVTTQRKQRNQARSGSVLLDVPGIGEKRRKALLKHFGSLAVMRRARLEQICEVEGMNKAAANALYNYLHNDGNLAAGKE